MTPGARLGPYEIVAPLGAGSMGEVYRARDARLGRDVAVKVLPEEFSGDSERVFHFQQEARATGMLNHPNILSVYDIGTQDGRLYLVSELLEGETLRTRLEPGPLPHRKALEFAQQVANGLDAAHHKGITHRDLKPDNLFITRAGQIKILDFGLAKVETPELANTPAPSGTMLLGTVGYMSPEQARGEPADARSDIFSLGAVLYEMIAGRRAFEAATKVETMMLIMRQDPPPLDAPIGLQKLIHRCLEKVPGERFQSAGDLGFAIDALIGSVSAGAIVTPPKKRLPWATAAAVALGIALTALALIHFRPAQTTLQPLARLDVALGVDAQPPSASFPDVSDISATLSPDGTRLVFAARSDAKTQLYSRLLDQTVATPLPGTDDAALPFFSPDGQWIGFFGAGKLKKISTQGGLAVTLCDAPNPRGASWGDDGDIIAALNFSGGLSRVSSTDGCALGAPKHATELDAKSGERTHRWPQVLPGSQTILFTSNRHSGGFDDADVEVLSVKNNQRKTLQKAGYFGRYLPSGHLIYVHEGTLFAAPMSLERMELTGPSVPILQEVSTKFGNGSTQFDASASGLALYADGKQESAHAVSWLSASGAEPLLDVPAYQPRVSPDGKRLAYTLRDSSTSTLWIYDEERKLKTQLPGSGRGAIWAPDGQHIAFSSGRRDTRGIYWMRSDGAGEAVRLYASINPCAPYSISPDGKWLSFVEQSPENGYDIWMLPLDGASSDHPVPGKPEVFLNTKAEESTPMFSPDGRWVAYSSNESGRTEVYARPFGKTQGKWQVSIAGGSSPVWSPKLGEMRSGEVLYIAAGKLMASAYTARADALDFHAPRVWSERKVWNELSGVALPGSAFDLMPDGKRAVVLTAPPGAETASHMHVIFLLNFFDELRRKALKSSP